MVPRISRRSFATTRPDPGRSQNDQPAARDATSRPLSARHDQLSDLLGYRVLGRYGELGTVIEVKTVEGDVGEPALVVLGGMSAALLYHVPSRRILSVSCESRTVTAEVEAADFLPRLRDDGTVVLRLRP